MCDKTIHDLMHDMLEDEKREAVKEALEKNKIEIANDMIKEGLPTNLIAKITHLDLNSIKQLQLEK